MEILAIPTLIIICLLPFFLIYKGIQKSQNRQNKAEQIFKEITTCKNCGRRNYEINVHEHEEQYQDFSNDFKDISKIFKINCKKCNLVVYNQSFGISLKNDGGHGLGRPRERQIYDRYYENVSDQELIDELKNTHYYGQGCSQYFLIFSGIGLIIMIVIAFLLNGL